ncbi:MAG: hypothetical protein JNM66_29485 [Bryobacterales bacterium]|nr:hypothetical protein [Bryobacterales bacterium]
MRIYRRGSKKDHGATSISLDAARIEVSPTNSFLSFSKFNVKDFTGTARHDYTVYLSFEELANSIKLVADAAVNDPKRFEGHFESVLKSLIRLQAVAAGTIQPPSPGAST